MRRNNSNSSAQWAMNRGGLGQIAEPVVVNDAMPVVQESVPVQAPVERLLAGSNRTASNPQGQLTNTVNGVPVGSTPVAQVPIDATLIGDNGGNYNTVTGREGGTKLPDKSYIQSLKIRTPERYNQLLAEKAFHPGNAEAKALAKELGINQNGSERIKRSDAGTPRAKKEPVQFSAPEYIDQMIYGNPALEFTGYTNSEMGEPVNKPFW